jgi:hypothetical protein
LRGSFATLLPKDVAQAYSLIDSYKIDPKVLWKNLIQKIKDQNNPALDEKLRTLIVQHFSNQPEKDCLAIADVLHPFADKLGFPLIQEKQIFSRIFLYALTTYKIREGKNIEQQMDEQIRILAELMKSDKNKLCPKDRKILLTFLVETVKTSAYSADKILKQLPQFYSDILADICTFKTSDKKFVQAKTLNFAHHFVGITQIFPRPFIHFVFVELCQEILNQNLLEPSTFFPLLLDFAFIPLYSGTSRLLCPEIIYNISIQNMTILDVCTVQLSILYANKSFQHFFIVVIVLV